MILSYYTRVSLSWTACRSSSIYIHTLTCFWYNTYRLLLDSTLVDMHELSSCRPIPTAELGTIFSLLLLRGEVHIPVEWVLILRIL